MHSRAALTTGVLPAAGGRGTTSGSHWQAHTFRLSGLSNHWQAFTYRPSGPSNTPRLHGTVCCPCWVAAVPAGAGRAGLRGGAAADPRVRAGGGAARGAEPGAHSHRGPVGGV